MPRTSRSTGVQTKSEYRPDRKPWMNDTKHAPAVRSRRQTAAQRLAATSPAPTASLASPNKTSSQPRKPKSTPAKTPGAGTSEGEKRLRKFRKQPPQAFQDIFFRATTQRFYVLSRRRIVDGSAPAEVVELTGSTGNVYHVHIARQPSCTCPYAKQGNQCKHVVFVLHKVLNAPFDLVYQLALLSDELTQIFDKAPPISAPDAAESNDKKRKPIEGDCPICFSEMDADSSEAIVWCRAACGQNMHKDCFNMWAKSKPGEATCPFCRSQWEGEKDLAKSIDLTRGRDSEGYVNIRDQLPGISGVRDTSTYSRWSPYMGRRRRWL